MATVLKNFRYNLVSKNGISIWINSLLFFLIRLCFLYFLYFFEVFFAVSAFAADDLLKDALVDIKANFGLSSVFIKALYLMEIYYGWRKYRETHNPFAVGSIVLVAMALTYTIGKWVGA